MKKHISLCLVFIVVLTLMAGCRGAAGEPMQEGGPDISGPEEDSNAFSYSDEELCEMAVKYYVKSTGEAEPLAAAEEDADGETVTIQLYYNLGDHNSTCAWYQVARRTGIGKDVNSGGVIDLSEFDTKDTRE